MNYSVEPNLITNYNFDNNSLENRPYGLSAFIRLKNGADTIGLVIDSHIKIFDEIVIVINNCTDNSLQVCCDYLNKYPEKLKVLIYEPYVHPFGGVEHKNEPASSKHSFVNFSNIALQSTKFSYVMKLDDDHYCPQEYQERNAFLRDFDPLKVNYFSGINLAWNIDNKVGISENYPLAGNGDHFIVKVNKSTFFKKNDVCEYFCCNGMASNYIGLRYYHLKFLRENFGFNNVVNTERGSILTKKVIDMSVVSYSDFQKSCDAFSVWSNKSYFDERLKQKVIRLLSRFPIMIKIFKVFGSFNAIRADRLSKDFAFISEKDNCEYLTNLMASSLNRGIDDSI